MFVAAVAGVKVLQELQVQQGPVLSPVLFAVVTGRRMGQVGGQPGQVEV